MIAPVFEAAGIRVFQGDCIEVMRELPAESVHAVVTDPPYGIGFMGHDWDQPGREVPADREGVPSGHRRRSHPTTPTSQGWGKEGAGAKEAGRYDLSRTANRIFAEWVAEWAAECFRLLKPGGHMLVSGSPRTWHRLATGIEDAGFEIRDSIAWLNGSGFPKSLDVSKAIDKAAGATREVVSSTVAGKRLSPGSAVNRSGSWRTDDRPDYMREETKPATSEAAAWEGWGTALKPAFEPIVVARKPLIGTVAANVLLHGTGALNIDATRTAFASDADRAEAVAKNQHADFGTESGGNAVYGDFSMVDPKNYDGSKGRWPTNVALDPSQAEALDGQTGTRMSRGHTPARRSPASEDAVYGLGHSGQEALAETHSERVGGASRFFPIFRYEAKAPSDERPIVDGIQHPTVKPLDLMRWLVRLVTPPGGVVLEPFAGSGTTAEACAREGFDCVSIERNAEYIPLIVQRLSKDHQQSLFGEWETGS